MFALMGEGVSKRECLGLGESYKCVCVGCGAGTWGGGEWRLYRGGVVWLEG